MEARDYLTGSVSCVLKKGEELLLSEKSGIRPMLDWIGEGRALRDFDAADKIVGKAAAMLFVKAGIRSVYAAVLSRPGKEYLEKHGSLTGGGTVCALWRKRCCSWKTQRKVIWP